MNLMIKMSQQFYTKLLKTYNIKLLSDNFIFSTIAWMFDHKYRKYSKLNTWLKEQIDRPQEELIDLAFDLYDRDTDKTVINVVKWVTKNVKYKSDIYENWKGAYQTFLDKNGDCDDMNCLVYVLCRLAGVHQFSLFCTIGTMSSNGGHYFPLYYSTKEKKLVTLDTTYYPKVLSVANREDFNKLSYHKDIWYIFNEDICVKPLK